MESTPVIKMTHDGNEKKKSSTSLRELVMEALLSASSTGLAVSEIYEFVNRRCKKYDLAENKWKINVRNMLTTSVYFQCFPRKERDGRRGKCWKFNMDAYNLHLQMKGNRHPLASTPTQGNCRSFTGSIGEIPHPDHHASFSNFNASIVALNPSPAVSQPTTAPIRIHPIHEGNALLPSNITSAIQTQHMQTSSMHNQYTSYPIQQQQTHYSHETDFTNTARANPVDLFPYYNKAQQHAQFLGDSGTIERRNYVNRFTPYNVRDSRTFSYLQNTVGRPSAGHEQDTMSCGTQSSSQPYSLAPVNPDSSWISQAYPSNDTGYSYFPQHLYSLGQLRSADPYHYGMYQGTIDQSGRNYADQ